MARLNAASQWRRRGVRLLCLGIGLYLGLAVMLALVQRRLIYFPAKASTISPASADLPDGSVRTVQVATSDGLTLAGWLVAADDRIGTAMMDGDESQRDLMIYFPGNAGNRAQRGAICNVFRARRADVLLVDYRGYGENPGSPSEEGLYRDARAVWDFAVKELGRPPDRIYLYGESIGGAVAIGLVDRLHDGGADRRPAGLLLQGAFDSLVETAAHHYPWLPVRWLLRDRFPSVDRIGRIPCRLVHLHGARDRVVPLERGRRLFQAVPLRSADGFVKQFLELPEYGHNDIPLEELGRAFDRLRDDGADADRRVN